MPELVMSSANSDAAPGAPPHAGMLWIPAGTFRMGSEEHYPEERPVHRVSVDGFWIDRTPVTNARLPALRRRDEARHVRRDSAESRGLSRREEGAAPPRLARVREATQPGRPQRLSQLVALRARRRLAASRGPNSTIKGREDHPVVHIAYSDAVAYARVGRQGAADRGRMGVRRPRRARRRRVRVGQRPARRRQADGELLAGGVPLAEPDEDGFEGTSPVGSFPANGYGLVDITGNVWEWTTDWYSQAHAAEEPKACCVPRNPRGGGEAASLDPRQPQIRIPRKVIKGGSHLCAPNYCRRYRPAARFPEPVDTSTCHLGFRCIVRPSAQP